MQPEYDTDKIDRVTLALMYLVLHDRDHLGMARAWKGFDWETMNRLHEKGYISDPVSKARSVVLTPEAVERSRELFYSFFGLPEDPTANHVA